MKELSIEEKAKRYDELLLKLQKAKVDYNVCDEMYYRVIDDIVPELAKSEDERIRKAIHIYFDWLDGRKDYAPKGKYTIRDMIAWLEKQGEQKQDPCEHCADKRLNCHNFPCVKGRAFKQGKSVLEIINEENVDNANKVEQNPSWSEEDEEMLGEIIDFFENGTVKLQHDLSLYASWLKSLRPQNTWKPSDAQIKALEHFVRSISESGYSSPYENNTKLLYSLLEDLKKLK